MQKQSGIFGIQLPHKDKKEWSLQTMTAEVQNSMGTQSLNTSYHFALSVD